MFSFLKKKEEPIVAPKTKADYEKEIQEVQKQRQDLLLKQEELFRLMEATK